MNGQVVVVQRLTDGIVQITLQDKVHKNGLSPMLADAIVKAFSDVKSMPDCKVIILTGYDSYFCSGGTQDVLLSLAEARSRFDDVKVSDTPVACDIPVIAAMQGHGIGGGLVLGLFCDFTIFSKESIYTANFMRYGFTPGVGATYIIPKKFGVVLGHEMLLSARGYHGAELEKRGIPFPVVPRDQVLSHARQLAIEIADKPRTALMVLKRHLVSDVRRELPGYIEKELEMQELTIHEREVWDRIRTQFGG